MNWILRALLQQLAAAQSENERAEIATKYANMIKIDVKEN
jgi:hypothetical protein